MLPKSYSSPETIPCSTTNCVSSSLKQGSFFMAFNPVQCTFCDHKLQRKENCKIQLSGYPFSKSCVNPTNLCQSSLLLGLLQFIYFKKVLLTFFFLIEIFYHTNLVFLTVFYHLFKAGFKKHEILTFDYAARSLSRLSIPLFTTILTVVWKVTFTVMWKLLRLK